jgi:hypothetical protein
MNRLERDSRAVREQIFTTIFLNGPTGNRRVPESDRRSGRDRRAEARAEAERATGKRGERRDESGRRAPIPRRAPLTTRLGILEKQLSGLMEQSRQLTLMRQCGLFDSRSSASSHTNAPTRRRDDTPQGPSQ